MHRRHALVFVLWVIPVSTFGSVRQATPCETAAEMIMSLGTFFPPCYYGGKDPHYDLCYQRGPRKVTKAVPEAPDYAVNAGYDFPVVRNPHDEYARAEVLVRGPEDARTVEFSWYYYEAQGPVDLAFRIIEQNSNRVLLDHAEPGFEAQGCTNGSLCRKTWTSHILYESVLPIAAGTRMQRSTLFPSSVATSWGSKDSWEYIVCEEGCQINSRARAGGFGTLIFLALPVVVLLARRPRAAIVLVLLVSTAHARELPKVALGRAQGRPIISDAIPGLALGRGRKVQGGCEVPDGGLTVVTGADTYLNGSLDMDPTDCTFSVGDVDTREEPPPEPEDEGAAAGQALPCCRRILWNRSTLVLNVGDSIGALFNWPAVRDFSRVTRVWQGFWADDTGDQLFCATDQQHSASSIEFLGWDTYTNGTTFPDHLSDTIGYVRNSGGDPFLYDLFDLGLVDNYSCAQSRAAYFRFDGDPEVSGMPPNSFGHAMIAACVMYPHGNFYCVHHLAAGSVLPQLVVTLAGIDLPFPFYTRVSYEGSAKWSVCRDNTTGEPLDSVCPLEWVYPPIVWQ